MHATTHTPTQIFWNIITASSETLADKKYFYIFLGLAGLLFLGMFAIPLFAIMGNTVGLQAELLAWNDYVLLTLLSMLSSLVLTMQIRIWREVHTGASGRFNSATSLLGVLSGITSSVFASATCAMCLGALFSFMSFGTLLFFVTHRWYILSLGFLLLFTSLYFSSRRIKDGCATCHVSP